MQELEFLEIGDLWKLQNDTHLEIVAEYRKLNQTPDENCDYWTQEMSEWYEGLITQAKDAYYAGSPIMSDMAFDKLEELLRYIKPNSELLKQVGSKK